MVKGYRALVRVHHCPKRQIDGRVRVFQAGSEIPAGVLSEDDVKHMLRGKQIEEIHEAALPAAVEEPTQHELVASLDADLKAEHGQA